MKKLQVGGVRKVARGKWQMASGKFRGAKMRRKNVGYGLDRTAKTSKNTRIVLAKTEGKKLLFSVPSFKGCVCERCRWQIQRTISTGTIRSITKPKASETTIL